MEDVTDKSEGTIDLPEMTEQETYAEDYLHYVKQLEAEAVKGTNLMANIKPYFNGNQYFMSVFKILQRRSFSRRTDHSAIGKFGGDTDNWMWPRHTGDFSVLRIYAGCRIMNLRRYSADNKPYRPATFFKISNTR